MNIDLSLNRVYWEYVQNKTYLRPPRNYLCTSLIPCLGVRATVPKYKRRSKSFHRDLTALVKAFAQKYPDYQYVISLSGGIDSEVTAETFYQCGIPFRAVIQRLFKGANDYDIIFAVKYCQQRNIPFKIVDLSLDKLKKETIPDAVKYGQFTHSYSQIALCNLFNYVDRTKEILINSGHNPDFHKQIGIGWWEDSPNIVKYAIAKDFKFFTFTSLEPIFCHYAANYDQNQPGDKNNNFLYEAFPHLKRRIKMTGWEKSDNITVELTQDIVKEANFRYQSFITWEEYTLAFIKKVFEQKRFKAFHPAMLEEIVYWVKGKYYA
tara:strand:+ start:374 stop:1336 length:963 start_codon:yes stop_codon:yes gene_type:complete